MPVQILWWLYWEHYLQLVLPAFSWPIDFFQFSSIVLALTSLFSFFQFNRVQLERQSPQFNRFSFIHWLSPSLVVWLRLDDPFVSQIQRNMCVSFSRTDSELCIYRLFVWLSLNLFHNSLWITFPHPVLSSLILFCAYLQPPFMWLIVPSLSPHNLHLLFSCISSILALIWLILMALFWASIRRDSVLLWL